MAAPGIAPYFLTSVYEALLAFLSPSPDRTKFQLKTLILSKQIKSFNFYGTKKKDSIFIIQMNVIERKFEFFRTNLQMARKLSARKFRASLRHSRDPKSEREDAE